MNSVRFLALLAVAALAVLGLARVDAAAAASARMTDDMRQWLSSPEFESLVSGRSSSPSIPAFDTPESSLAEVRTDAELQSEAAIEAEVEQAAAQAARNRAKLDAQLRQLYGLHGDDEGAAAAADAAAAPADDAGAAAGAADAAAGPADAGASDASAAAAAAPADASASSDAAAAAAPTESASAASDAQAVADAAASTSTSSSSTEGTVAGGVSVAANATTAGAASSPDASGAKPTLPWDDVRLRLRKHRATIVDMEGKMREQTKKMRAHLRQHPVPALQGEMSSGENYWNRGIAELKRSDGVVVKDAASELRQSDARCVICQFVVQQAVGILTGKPLTSGGATSGGKRAAGEAAAPSPDAVPMVMPAAVDAGAAAPAAFLEFDQAIDALDEELGAESDAEGEADPFAFLELEAGVSVMAESGLSAVLAAELESTVALDAAMRTFLSAADAAMQHSASEALRLHYPRSRARRQPLADAGGARNLASVSYPRQLNDWGYEDTARNRRADRLAFRPRQARFSRGDINAAKAKWDQVHATYDKLYAGVYAAFEKLCSRGMPLAYVGYCHSMMRDYRYIAQGLMYGDKAASICMNGNWCDRKSYIRHAVHAYFVREAGDS